MVKAKNIEESEEFEELTSEEIESIEISEEEMKEMEMEELEAEAFEDLEEQEEAEALPLVGVAAAKILSKRMMRIILEVLRKLILKLLSNATTLRKLKIACKKGPAFVCKFLCAAVCKQFPPVIRPICAKLCLKACYKIQPWLCRKVGA